MTITDLTPSSGDDLLEMDLGFIDNYYKCDIEVSRGSKVFHKRGFTACDSSYRFFETGSDYVRATFFFDSPSELGGVDTGAVTAKVKNCVSLLDNITKALVEA